jgi:hypothetical protein
VLQNSIGHIACAALQFKLTNIRIHLKHRKLEAAAQQGPTMCMPNNNAHAEHQCAAGCCRTLHHDVEALQQKKPLGSIKCTDIANIILQRHVKRCRTCTTMSDRSSTLHSCRHTSRLRSNGVSSSSSSSSSTASCLQRDIVHSGKNALKHVRVKDHGST